MHNLHKLILFSILFFPLSSCQNSSNLRSEIDNKGYLTEFNLIQENPINNSTIIINSPKAIIDQKNNDLKIFDSSIEFNDTSNSNIFIKSGESSINQSTNTIESIDNVNISFGHDNLSNITTDKLFWNLDTSIIVIDSKLIFNFDDTKILSDKGIYFTNISQLILDNVFYQKNFTNAQGDQIYNIIIKSDSASWLKENKLLEFTSTNKQVESNILLFSY